MRKLLVILLLGIFAFNSAGYRLLVSWLEDRANTKLEISLDHDEYNSRDEIILMTPITHLSYYNSSTEFIRQDGRIDIDGNSYKFVKMRLHGDSVEIICIPDYPAQKSLALQNHFVRWNTDTQQTGQTKKSGGHYRAYKMLKAEFDASGNQYAITTPYRILSKKIFHFYTYVSTYSSPVIENPPEPLC